MEPGKYFGSSNSIRVKNKWQRRRSSELRTSMRGAILSALGRLLGLQLAKSFLRLFGLVVLLELPVNPRQEIPGLRRRWVERNRPLEPVCRQFRLAELVQRLGANIEASLRLGIAVGCFGSRIEGMLGVSGF